MPQWLQDLLRRRNDWFWLETRRSGLNEVQHYVGKQPKGHWLVGRAINSNGKYLQDELNIYISNGDGTISVVRLKINRLHASGITDLETMETALISKGVALAQGGFIDFRAYKQLIISAYMAVDDFDSFEDSASSMSSLRSSGGGSHL